MKRALIIAVLLLSLTGCSDVTVSCNQFDDIDLGKPSSIRMGFSQIWGPPHYEVWIMWSYKDTLELEANSWEALLCKLQAHMEARKKCGK